MAEYGVWNQKGATLSDVTARAEYGVSREFVIDGIKTGKLEYKEGDMWGNPYFRIIRSQLEELIIERLGTDYLEIARRKTELQKVKKEIREIKKTLDELQKRKVVLAESLKKTDLP